MDDDNDSLIIIATVLLSFLWLKEVKDIWLTRIQGYDDKEVWLILKIQKSPKLP
jgi:hypothetical protein